VSGLLRRIDGILCDLDGVVYRGKQPIPGAAEAIASWRRRGLRIVFCTNNSSRTAEQVVAKLDAMGVPISSDEVLTSAMVTAEVLDERGATGKRAIVVGGEGLKRALALVGIVVEERPQARRADFVLVGWDRSFDYEAMRNASMAVRAGATLIASNDDATFPASDGLWPGAGAILASIETASGATAEVMGKPHKPMMEAAARRLDGAESIAVVGDRPDTDLAGGAAMGWTTILVLSGVTAPEARAGVVPAPDVVVNSLADLVV
jgi:4-nitrophenyl phosphatase